MELKDLITILLTAAGIAVFIVLLVFIYLLYQLSKSTNENKYPEQNENRHQETEVNDNFL